MRPGALGSTLRKGAVISAGVLAFVQVMSLVQTLVVARLLSPAEVGIFAAGTVLTGLLYTFTEGGLRAALVQREGNVDDAADTVFWASLGTGLLMSLATLAAAPLVATVFYSELAGRLAAAASGIVLLRSLTTVPDALLQRRFNFKRRLVVDPSVAVSFFVVAVVLATLGYGPWALLAGTYASQVVAVVTFWSAAGWRPGAGRVSFRLWRELAWFGSPMVVEDIVQRIRDVVESAVVGRRLDAASLGQYRYGKRLGLLPGLAVIEIGAYVLFPAFSRISGDAQRFREAFLRALGWIWFAVMPVTALLVAVGEPLVVILLGERWRGAGVAMVALSGYGLGEAMNAVSYEAMKGAGRSRRLNWANVLNLVLGIGLLFALVPFGLFGVGLAISITSVVVGVTGLALARTVVGVTAREIIGRMAPPTAAAVIGLGAVAPFEHLVARSDTHPLPVAVGVLLLESLAFLTLYMVTLRIIAPDLFSGVVRVARAFGRRPAPAVGPVDDQSIGG